MAPDLLIGLKLMDLQKQRACDGLFSVFLVVQDSSIGNAIFWPIFGYFVMILRVFWCIFTCLNNEMVYHN